jgi:hypothetical protein
MPAQCGFSSRDSYALSFFLSSPTTLLSNYAVCMPNPGSIPACFKALAFRESASLFSAFCDAASVLTSSSSANFAPLGASSRSKSTVAHIVTFSPRIVMTPGSLTSCISQRGTAFCEDEVGWGVKLASPGYNKKSGLNAPNWSYDLSMPMYSFSSRSKTSTFSAVRKLWVSS